MGPAQEFVPETLSKAPLLEPPWPTRLRYAFVLVEAKTLILPWSCNVDWLLTLTLLTIVPKAVAFWMFETLAGTPAVANAGVARIVARSGQDLRSRTGHAERPCRCRC